MGREFEGNEFKLIGLSSRIFVMSGEVQLSKSDVRRAMVRHHFAESDAVPTAFERLRSIQFDPIAPVGCNHDLVLQARVPGYRIGDWQKTAYDDRVLYDGWDKQASLIPFEGWPVRRFIYGEHRKNFEKKIFEDHCGAVEAILKEIEDRGPLMPRDCESHGRREDWVGSWHGAGVTKQVLRALWHSGILMTAGRNNGQHQYDLTERVVPQRLRDTPQVSKEEGIREVVLERHRAVGIIRPAAPYEIWAVPAIYYVKRVAIAELVARGEVVPVDVEGMKANATPEFLRHLELPSLEKRVVFVAPLDQFMWDRKLIKHVFGFDYVWEIYVPEAKRRWGYYVLPILYGEELVGRVEFWCRDGVLEVRKWHAEGDLDIEFWSAFEVALRKFMGYCSATKVVVTEKKEKKLGEIARLVTS